MKDLAYTNTIDLVIALTKISVSTSDKKEKAAVTRLIKKIKENVYGELVYRCYMSDVNKLVERFNLKFSRKIDNTKQDSIDYEDYVDDLDLTSIDIESELVKLNNGMNVLTLSDEEKIMLINKILNQ